MGLKNDAFKIYIFIFRISEFLSLKTQKQIHFFTFDLFHVLKQFQTKMTLFFHFFKSAILIFNNNTYPIPRLLPSLFLKISALSTYPANFIKSFNQPHEVPKSRLLAKTLQPFVFLSRKRLLSSLQLFDGEYDLSSRYKSSFWLLLFSKPCDLFYDLFKFFLCFYEFDYEFSYLSSYTKSSNVLSILTAEVPDQLFYFFRSLFDAYDPFLLQPVVSVSIL